MTPMLAGHHVHPLAPAHRDLTCIVCGRTVKAMQFHASPFSHGEDWRDAGHAPLVVEELDATPEPQRRAFHRGPVGLRGVGGARR